MKKFRSIQSAINYHKNCPVCFQQMQINDKDLAADYYGDNLDTKSVSFWLDVYQNDILTIHLSNDDVEVTDMVYEIGEHSTFYIPNTRKVGYHGKFLQGMTLDCKICCKFSYTLQVHVDLEIKKLTGIFLNSETLTVEEGSVVHEIKSIYSTKQTEYARFEPGSDKRVNLPLIPLDLKNPEETIKRVKKLIIFS